MEDLKRKVLEKKGYTVKDDSDVNSLIDNFVFNNLNTCNIELILTCGHEHKGKISSIYNKDVNCKECKNLDKYNYDINKNERTCTDCGYVHKNISRSNLKKWKCWKCKDGKRLKAEVLLGRLLSDKGYDVCKSYKYINEEGIKTSKTGDLYFEHNDETIVIEVDENSHLIKKNRNSHMKKDIMILHTENTRLIRVNSNEVENIAKCIEDVLKLKEKIIIFATTNESKKFFEKLYPLYENVKFFKADEDE